MTKNIRQIFVVVAIQIEKSAGSLFFYRIATTSKIKLQETNLGFCVLVTSWCNERNTWDWKPFVSLDNFEKYHSSNAFFFLNYFSGGNKKSSSIAQLAIPATSPRELLGSEQQQKQMDHHPASGFGTKDSSDSKSHDSGIDSIEKPGMSFGVLRFVGG